MGEINRVVLQTGATPNSQQATPNSTSILTRAAGDSANPASGMNIGGAEAAGAGSSPPAAAGAGGPVDAGVSSNAAATATGGGMPESGSGGNVSTVA